MSALAITSIFSLLRLSPHCVDKPGLLKEARRWILLNLNSPKNCKHGEKYCGGVEIKLFSRHHVCSAVVNEHRHL